MSVVLIVACRVCGVSAVDVDPWVFEAEHECAPPVPVEPVVSLGEQ